MDTARFGRRSFLVGLGATCSLSLNQTTIVGSPIERVGGPRIRLSLNAYSFNGPLRSGEMSLDELLDFCAQHNFDAIDLTGYYLPGYPDSPSREVLNRVKQRAYLLGLDISGTGVRNDFRNPDPAQRATDVALVRRWIEVSAWLGAPALRIFAGRTLEAGQDRKEATDWVVDSIGQCAEFAADHGVMLVLQNHAEFLENSKQVLEILDRVGSPWLAMNLDIGSFHGPEPYREIAEIAPYATTLQIKEMVYIDGEPQQSDLGKVAEILRSTGFRGYILVETLGEGDPRVKVPKFLERVRAAFGSNG